jgi:hypothetical protein
MEIEGSGTLRLPNGREVRVGMRRRMAVRTGASVGSSSRKGRSREAMTTGCFGSAHRASREGPGSSDTTSPMSSSVSFRGAVGSLGVTLTPGARSPPTHAFSPGGARVHPDDAASGVPEGLIAWKPFGRFVLSQDAGGAVRGPGRVDIFWGRSPYADLAASEMKEPGELYFVVPKANGSGAGAQGGRRPRCCESDTGLPPPSPADQEAETRALPEEPAWRIELPCTRKQWRFLGAPSSRQSLRRKCAGHARPMRHRGTDVAPAPAYRPALALGGACVREGGMVDRARR